MSHDINERRAMVDRHHCLGEWPIDEDETDQETEQTEIVKTVASAWFVYIPFSSDDGNYGCYTGGWINLATVNVIYRHRIIENNKTNSLAIRFNDGRTLSINGESADLMLDELKKLSRR